MKCSEVRRFLDLLAGGDLEPKESELLLEHLESCPGCMKEYDSCKRSLRAVSLLGISSMGEEIPGSDSPLFWKGLEKTVEERIAQGKGKAGMPLAWFGAGFAAAAGLLLALWFAWPASQGAPRDLEKATGPSPVAGVPAMGGLVPVKGPLPHSRAKGVETQGGAVPVEWFGLPSWFTGRRQSRQNPAEAVPVVNQGRF